MPSARYVRRALAIATMAAACTQCEVPERAASAGAPSPDSASSAAPATEPPYPTPAGETTGAAIAILIDNSGSMAARAPGDKRRKYLVARSAINEVMRVTREHVRDHPEYPVRIGVYRFADSVQAVLPIAPYDSAALRRALQGSPAPEGNTAIGDAMEVARRDLYRAGLIRKYILVITDGESTVGRPPEEVVAEISRRSEQRVRMYYVAFDVDAGNFAFVRQAGGDVFSARNGEQLRAALAEVYRGRILAESEEYGDAFPQPATHENETRSAQP